MKVTISKSCIKKGVRRSASFCPIALALRNVKGVSFASVGIDRCHVHGNGEKTRIYMLPLEARKFIHDFDENKYVEPITFEIREAL